MGTLPLALDAVEMVLCYASVAGRMEEAKERLRHAIELDKEARELALEDEDLKPLWDWIAGSE